MQPDVEQCAGALLRRRSDRAVLLIRCRATAFELPKGHIEPGESPEQAAARELCEETGLRHAPPVGPLLAELHYYFDGRPPVHKRVRCFLFEADDAQIELGPRPTGIRECRWVDNSVIRDLVLTSENLRPIVAAATARQPG